MIRARGFVVFSLLAGAAVVIRQWLSWSGPNALSKLQFWETLFDPHLHKFILLNMGCNILYLVGKAAQLIFLGQLREMEAYKVGDRVRSYALVKAVFIGAIVHEHDDKELIIWFVWLSTVGFLKQIGLLARDRLEFMTLSVNTSTRDYIKLVTLLGLVVAADVGLIWICLRIAGCWSRCQPGGFGVLFLLLFENGIILVDALQTIIRYLLHMINQAKDGHWENRALYSFYSELGCELVNHVLNLLHYLHVWAVHGLSCTLTDALLFLNTRAVVNNIRSKFASLKNFVTMDKKFRDATAEELEQQGDDFCSICREPMSSAKVLPCGHVFHLVCLRAWLEHSSTCPNCRRPIDGSSEGSDVQDGLFPIDERDIVENRDAGEGRDSNGGEGGGRRQWNLFNWLPFSVEVNTQRVPDHDPIERERNRAAAVHNQALQMAHAVPHDLVRQVLDVLPHLSTQAIQRDLALTLDVQLTIHRGLDGMIPSDPSDNNDAPSQTGNTGSGLQTEGPDFSEESVPAVSASEPAGAQQQSPAADSEEGKGKEPGDEKPSGSAAGASASEDLIPVFSPSEPSAEGERKSATEVVSDAETGANEQSSVAAGALAEENSEDPILRRALFAAAALRRLQNGGPDEGTQVTF